MKIVQVARIRRAGRSRLLAFVACITMLLTVLLAPMATAAAAGGTDYARGQTAARQGHYTQAATAFEQALLHGHTDPMTFYQLGLAYQHSKRLNQAVWAIAQALTDPTFSLEHPEAARQLLAVSQAGGMEVGAPSALKGVTITPGKISSPSPALLAQQEALTAFTIFQDPGQAYYVSQGFGRTMRPASLQTLVQAANDADNNSNTKARFLFLDAVPAPYTSLSAYAQDLLHQLMLRPGLRRLAVIVIAPGQSAAATDRLGLAAANRINMDARAAAGAGDPASLAVSMARTIVSTADQNDRQSNIRAAIIGGALTVLLLGLLGLAVTRVLRGSSRKQAHAARARRLPRGAASKPS